MNISHSAHSVNSFNTGGKFNAPNNKSIGHEGNSDVYCLNLNTNNYNHTISNNYQNNNFHNNSGSKQILFTSIKNTYKREKKYGNQLNFQIMKTNPDLETAPTDENTNNGNL